MVIMSPDALPSLRILYEFADAIGLDPKQVTATDLVRRFVPLQMGDAVRDMVSDGVIGAEEMDRMRKQDRFPEYHPPTATEMNAKPQLFYGQFWYSLFHNLSVPIDVGKHATLDNSTLRMKALFDRDVREIFGADRLSTYAMLPLFVIVSQLPKANLRATVHAWPSNEIPEDVKPNLVKFLVDWTPKNQLTYAEDLVRILNNVEFPENTADVAKQRLVNERKRVSEPCQRSADRDPRPSDYVEVSTAAIPRDHAIAAVAAFAKRIGGRTVAAMPRRRQELLYLVSQMPNVEANFKLLFDEDDAELVRSLTGYARWWAETESSLSRGEDERDEEKLRKMRIEQAFGWMRFLENAIGTMRDRPANLVPSQSKSYQDTGQADAFVSEISNTLSPGELAALAPQDRISRLLTIYVVHGWEDRWRQAFGRLDDTTEEAIVAYRRVNPNLDQNILLSLEKVDFRL